MAHRWEIRDPVWGTWRVEDPVLRDLLDCLPLRRLAAVHQSGPSYLVRPELTTTRLEHSLGAVRLVQLLGGPREEQVAALLHDVAHTAFSHVADLVFPEAGRSYHELRHGRVVLGSPIPAILARHGVPLGAALEPEAHSLLERPLPDLCADRVDYCVRDMQRLGAVAPAEIRRFVEALTVFDGVMALRDLAAARWFLHLYRDANLRLYMNPLDTWVYVVMAEALRDALDRGVIAEADLFATDAELLARLRADPLSARRLARLTPETPRLVRESGREAADVFAYPKPRAVDPPVVLDGRLHRASDLDPSLKADIEATLRRARRGVGARLTRR